MRDLDAKISLAVARARSNGESLDNIWIEVPKELLMLLDKGNDGTKHFCYKGAKVCALGMSESIQEDMDTPMHKKTHPEDNKNIEVLSG